jgi:hypothetical protein
MRGAVPVRLVLAHAVGPRNRRRSEATNEPQGALRAQESESRRMTALKLSNKLRGKCSSGSENARALTPRGSWRSQPGRQGSPRPKNVRDCHEGQPRPHGLSDALLSLAPRPAIARCGVIRPARGGGRWYR